MQGEDGCIEMMYLSTALHRIPHSTSRGSSITQIAHAIGEWPQKGNSLATASDH